MLVDASPTDSGPRNFNPRYSTIRKLLEWELKDFLSDAGIATSYLEIEIYSQAIVTLFSIRGSSSRDPLTEVTPNTRL